jgi:hypothetical protein
MLSTCPNRTKSVWQHTRSRRACFRVCRLGGWSTLRIVPAVIGCFVVSIRTRRRTPSSFLAEPTSGLLKKRLLIVMAVTAHAICRCFYLVLGTSDFPEGAPNSPTFGGAMAYSLITDPVARPEAQCKPHLSSYDSGQECSLSHWLDVCRLVELAEVDYRDSRGYVFDDSLLLRE